MSTTTDSINSSSSDLLGFTCASCLTSYPNEIEYKMHYKSDYHKYNILRKMVNLPIVSKTQFERHQAESKKVLKKAPAEGEKFYCKICNKKFANEQTYRQHLLTKKHLKAAQEAAMDHELNNAELQDPQPDANAFKKPKAKDSFPRGDPLTDNKACLFCSRVFDSFEENLAHMESHHNFFILDKQFCFDKEGLFKHLAKKIFVKKIPIYLPWDNYGKFATGRDVQSHMISKGECTMNVDHTDEYEKFYDYSEENERILKALEAKHGKQRGGEEFELLIDSKGAFVDADAPSVSDANEDDEGSWEDVDSDAEEVDEDAEQEIKEEKNSEADQKAHKEGVRNARRIFKLRRAKMLESGELLLPSGRIAGHKDFKVYYKQRPHVNPEADVRRLENGRAVYTGKKTYEQALMISRNMKNGDGQIMLSDFHRHMMRQRMKVDKTLKKAYRKRDINWMKLGVDGNLVLRGRFRDRNIVFG